ncbi:MAG: glutathione S-transferase, partial [Alphaproteobacteria bacterium]|nr:glutathione S-transferase [Alphaproteobacteria bacterium]
MIHLYSWNTSNGKKISVMLEELGLDYEFHPINISKDEQFAPDFLEISPNNRIPAIVDTDGPDGESISVFESGAILIYLAEKAQSNMLPSDPRKRMQVLEWLMW